MDVVGFLFAKFEKRFYEENKIKIENLFTHFRRRITVLNNVKCVDFNLISV